MSSETLWLAPHVRLAQHPGGECVLHSGLVQLTVGPGMGLEMIAVLRDQGATLTRLSATYGSEIALVRELVGSGFLSAEPQSPTVGTPWEREYGYLSTRTTHPASAQARLQCGTLFLLGLGGIAVIVIQHAVAAGVRRFVLIDSDNVERSNLNRQFIYCEADIGHAKTVAASRYIRARTPDAHIVCAQRRVVDVNDLPLIEQAEGRAVFVQAADRPLNKLNMIAATYCKKNSMSLVGGAASEFGGYWGPLIPSEAVDRFDAFIAEWATHIGPALDEAVPWYSHAPFNTIVAANIAHLALVELAGLARPRASSGRQWLNVDQAELEVRDAHQAPD